ncbi:MAG: helix-turn-helix domain-containing protein [Rhodobacterales bacterium]|nr:helix-turn-helix domain-containing protein [Rhodobacterales bacterium]
MPEHSLVGNRIRQKRVALGMRQVELARAAGISGSYLNLIEHNRRRIGGKLLLKVASVLGVAPSLLSEGAEAAFIAALRAAAADQNQAQAVQADEFAGRFPQWAQVLAATHARAASLEHIVETLTDRLTHDPHMAASLHEVISSVTAIRATAAILTDTKHLEPEWRARFQRNIGEDSHRLAESAQSLVAYLDGAAHMDKKRATSPQEEFETFLEAHEYHFPTLETQAQAEDAIGDLIGESADLGSEAARHMARAHLGRYQNDAARMPLDAVIKTLEDHPVDPAALAGFFNVDLAAMLRRLGGLPANNPLGPVGLAICDASGTLTFRKPLPGFPIPRFGAACPLWPLFGALSRPLVPLRMTLRQSGRGGGDFIGYAISQPIGAARFNQDPLYEAHMLIVPQDAGDRDARKIGVSCRICSKKSCVGRREPSIITAEH